MKLNSPTKNVFLICLILAIVSVVAVFIPIPFISAYAYWILAAAFGLLAASCVLKGL